MSRSMIANRHPWNRLYARLSANAGGWFRLQRSLEPPLSRARNSTEGAWHQQASAVLDESATKKADTFISILQRHLCSETYGRSSLDSRHRIYGQPAPAERIVARRPAMSRIAAPMSFGASRQHHRCNFDGTLRQSLTLSIRSASCRLICFEKRRGGASFPLAPSMRRRAHEGRQRLCCVLRSSALAGRPTRRSYLKAGRARHRRFQKGTGRAARMCWWTAPDRCERRPSPKVYKSGSTTRKRLTCTSSR